MSLLNLSHRHVRAVARFSVEGNARCRSLFGHRHVFAVVAVAAVVIAIFAPVPDSAEKMAERIWKKSFFEWVIFLFFIHRSPYNCSAQFCFHFTYVFMRARSAYTTTTSASHFLLIHEALFCILFYFLWILLNCRNANVCIFRVAYCRCCRCCCRRCRCCNCKLSISQQQNVPRSSRRTELCTFAAVLQKANAKSSHTHTVQSTHYRLFFVRSWARARSGLAPPIPLSLCWVDVYTRVFRFFRWCLCTGEGKRVKKINAYIKLFIPIALNPPPSLFPLSSGPLVFFFQLILTCYRQQQNGNAWTKITSLHSKQIPHSSKVSPPTIEGTKHTVDTETEWANMEPHKK